MIAGHAPALLIIVPLSAAILAAVLRNGRIAFILTLLASLAVLALAGVLLERILAQGTISYHIGSWEPPWGIEYRLDSLNGFVILLVAAIGAVAAPYAWRSVQSEIAEDRQAWFYALYLLCFTGLLGIAATGDVFNAFVFLEISSLASYALIGMGRDRRALLSAYQYLIMGTIGATFYVIGIGFLYIVTGTLNMADLAKRLDTVEQIRPVLAGLGFIVVGIALKLALFPLHLWLPNAYAFAPSFVTAFLAGTATKVAIYLLIRFVFGIVGIDLAFQRLALMEVLLAFSAIAIVAASAVAIFQNDIKRMLAYSSVAQIGYITLGIGLASKAGLSAALVHVVNHALTKSALFLLIGGIAYRLAGRVRLADMAGLGRRMPWTMAGFVVAGISLIGGPATVGFVSKWYLAVAAAERGWWWLVALIVASSILALVYVGRVVEAAWFREPQGNTANAGDAPLSLLIPAWILVAACVYFGLDTSLTYAIAEQAAGAIFGGMK